LLISQNYYGAQSFTLNVEQEKTEGGFAGCFCGGYSGQGTSYKSLLLPVAGHFIFAVYT